MKILSCCAVAMAVVMAATGAARAADHMDHMAHMATNPVTPDHMQVMCGDMDAKMAGHLAYAEVKLGLGESQKVAFSKLKETMKAAHEPMKKVCAEIVAQPPATTLPTHMERMRKMMEVRVSVMGKVIPAMTGFYDTLTPEQKKTADALMMSHHAGMGH
ncbi:conserved exported protein of unknown function（containing LTXXQ motif family protein domain,54-149) [Magnetospirillum sp. XM-1]|uniref:Spy/CpxP family protein refolding chaperone n=1 Tax=Magnetospirillum sp. XM-1 TaxID=1663591 RepID=UPI00073DEDCD|nr:Spy/CpxP family protein refolding chaperone [Magnetospirillum sp. XM-1]CUW40786.1 conserved exported protein of unknown function\